MTVTGAHKTDFSSSTNNEQKLDQILKIGGDWWRLVRHGHSGRDHLLPVPDSGDPPGVDLAKQKLVCHTELGGHLKSYRDRAAD
jgi:putative transposase